MSSARRVWSRSDPWAAGNRCTVREAKGLGLTAREGLWRHVWKLMWADFLFLITPLQERLVKPQRPPVDTPTAREEGDKDFAPPVCSLSAERTELGPGADGGRCNVWGGGAGVGEVLEGSPAGQLLGGLRADYFSFFLGKKGLLCDRAALLVSCGIFPLPWVCSSQAGISDSSAVRRQWQRPGLEIW